MQPSARGGGVHGICGQVGTPNHGRGLTPGFNSAPSHPIFACMEQFGLTERAATRIAEIVAAEGRGAALRVAVLAGGCSGFQYRFELDETPREDDLVIERAGAKVLVDPASLDLLAG